MAVAFLFFGAEAMAEPTVAEMLANVRTAINDALLAGGAVEFELNGRRVRRDYAQLLEIEKNLMARQASTGTTGPRRAYASFERRPT